MRIVRKILLIVGLFLFAAFCVFGVIYAELPVDGDPAYTVYALDDPVDRVVIFDAAREPVKEITDQGMISSFKKAHRWTNTYEICCDEDTTYYFVMYNGDKWVHSASYAGLGSGYNNFSFRFMQWFLLSFGR